MKYRSKNWLEPSYTSPRVACTWWETYKTSEFAPLVWVLVLQVLLCHDLFCLLHFPETPFPCESKYLWPWSWSLEGNCIRKEIEKDKSKPYKNPLPPIETRWSKLLTGNCTRMISNFRSLVCLRACLLGIGSFMVLLGFHRIEGSFTRWTVFIDLGGYIFLDFLIIN